MPKKAWKEITVAISSAEATVQSIRRTGFTHRIIKTLGNAYSTPRKYCKTVQDAMLVLKRFDEKWDHAVTIFPGAHFSITGISNSVFSEAIDRKNRNNCKAFYSFTISILPLSKLENKKDFLLECVISGLACRIQALSGMNFKDMSISANSSDLHNINVGIMIRNLAAK